MCRPISSGSRGFSPRKTTLRGFFLDHTITGNALKLDSCADLQVASADRGTTDCAGSLRPAGSRQIHRIVEVAVRGTEVGVIEDIGCIRTELQADALDDVEG